MRRFAEESAARARTTAGQIRGIADYADPALADIAMRSGMVPGSYTSEMAGNVPYQSGLMAGQVESGIGQLQGVAAEMPRLINAYRAYKAEQDKKSGSGGGSVVMPTTPEIPVLGDYSKYLNVTGVATPSISRLDAAYTSPYQYTAPNLPPTAKPMSTVSAAYKRMLESRAKK